MIGKKGVEKPVTRGRLRKKLGKKYFTLKRKWKWLTGNAVYAKQKSDTYFEHQVKQHSSMLLRPLKDVDMQYQHNKITNLKLAISCLNSVIIKPGQTFSLWYLVGNPSKNRGYLKGLVLSNGAIGYDYGGGLCQLGNLLYWMILHSPLTVTERWRHSYDVFPDVNRKLPFGSGATLSYNYVDFQFRNDTKHAFQLKLWLTEDRLHGELLSEHKLSFTYEVYEDYHFFQQEMWGGYTRHNSLRRKVFDNNNQLITDELITENHAIMMYNPMLADATADKRKQQ